MINSTNSPGGSTVAQAQVKRRLDPRQLGVNLSAGVIAGLLDIGVLLSLAALIFSGPLSPFIANGIGLLLVGTCVMNIALAVLSSRPAVIIYIQEAPAIMVALIAAGIAANMPMGTSPQGLYATVAAAIATTTLATGAVFIALGSFRLGSLVRYLPYPVVGGFLAGTGWLLLLGGVSVMTDLQPGLADVPGLLQPQLLWQWLPGLLFGTFSLLALRRSQHLLLLPGLFLGATALFYLWLAFAGISLAEAQANGWLLGPFSQQASWSPLTPSMLTEVQWPLIAAEFGAIGTAVTLGVIGLLLNVSGLQLVRGEDFDLNRELRSAGFAQIAAGLAASPPGFHALGLSTLGHRMGANSRLVGAVAGLCCGLVFFVGTEFLALLPRVVLGGLVFYMGLAFLTEWLYDAFFRLPRLDYALVVIILILIAVFGMLPGVVAGLAIAVVLFVIAYTQVDVVKHALNGALIRSRVTRTFDAQQRLREAGAQTAIFRLQGFLFFGTAHELYERVRRRTLTADLPTLRFAVLDFELVPRLDSTAMLSFGKMFRLAEAHGLTLVLTHLAPHIQRQFEQALLHDTSATNIRIFADLDRGLEWCENQLLADAGATDSSHQTLQAQLAQIVPEATNIDSLLEYFERRVVAKGDYLIRIDEPPDDMLFVASGQVTAQIEAVDGPPLRLETMGGGRVVGELGFYLDRPRTAAVVAEEAGCVYRITRRDLLRLEEEDPQAAATFHLIMARLLSERVVHLIETVEALRR